MCPLPYAELNPICHLLALLGAHHILHVSRIRVNINTLPISRQLFQQEAKPQVTSYVNCLHKLFKDEQQRVQYSASSASQTHQLSTK